MSLSEVFRLKEYGAKLDKLTKQISELDVVDEALYDKLERTNTHKTVFKKTEKSSVALIRENMTLAEKFALCEDALSKLEQTNEALRAEVLEQQLLLTDEHGRALDIKLHTAELENKRAEKVKQIEECETNIEKLENLRCKKEIEIGVLKEKIVELEETALLQDFGLYEPMYDFATSNEYKQALDDIRKEQKQMIKDKKAATCGTEWTVNESKVQGRKMINDSIKQVILSFNTECENAIDRVKFNNYDSMKLRIEKFFDKLNNMNASLNISISQQYLDLKFQELALAYEYARKKQEEKEYIREQREIQRESARVQKELEQERQRIEKEQTHYQNVLRRLMEQIEAEENEAKRELLQDKISAANGELADLEKALEDVDYRQANERAGYVYIISNIGAFGEGVYKIGMTRRLEPLDRVDELGDASVPFRFDVHALIFSADAPKLETALHNAFADKRVNMVNNRKEFYRVPLEDIERVVKQHHDKTVEFKYLPAAEQYRESEKMRKSPL